MTARKNNIRAPQILATFCLPTCAAAILLQLGGTRVLTPRWTSLRMASTSFRSCSSTVITSKVCVCVCVCVCLCVYILSAYSSLHPSWSVFLTWQQEQGCVCTGVLVTERRRCSGSRRITKLIDRTGRPWLPEVGNPIHFGRRGKMICKKTTSSSFLCTSSHESQRPRTDSTLCVFERAKFLFATSLSWTCKVQFIRCISCRGKTATTIKVATKGQGSLTHLDVSKPNSAAAYTKCREGQRHIPSLAYLPTRLY
ncbi:hypothetical protein EJ03DRAFT_168415 [Teratosphaeria nubilosa]|uniref:Uncharacterized protein n=1 Tax=Teratosphaeria nubilosa TaxID=161662 RepID=A0A6G1L1J2_9PEZI|nr:hypothetical protein EJ03DRAFT_168415 [Teratosphaeria nubilosa]